MDGRLLPPDYAALTPWWRNSLESIGAIQFNHRWAAVLTTILIITLWLRARVSVLHSGHRQAPSVMALLAIVQAGLGIATLLSRRLDTVGRPASGHGAAVIRRRRMDGMGLPEARLRLHGTKNR